MTHFGRNITRGQAWGHLHYLVPGEPDTVASAAELARSKPPLPHRRRRYATWLLLLIAAFAAACIAVGGC